MSIQVSLLTPVLLAGVLFGCTPHVDTRLADDQQTCVQMGHAAGSPIFQQCLAELNERRCALAASKTGPHHVASEDCTRLRTQR